MFRKQPKPKVSIYYDGGCGFCARGVELLVKWCMIRTEQIAPGCSDAAVFALMQAEDSWVVVNEKGEMFIAFAAGVEAARHSPLLGWLTPLARFSFVQKMGNRFYHWVARNRYRIWLPGLPKRISTQKLVQDGKQNKCSEY
ncbi:MAG: DUF393 domain-containing protein [Candidatus Kaiserbacteria bacterium]|nr:DUF393 domain-containing protein [Candidatus Kaiserbacteria bacterium]MCB9816190.1 DUF393 domain-containing protein [Candidatus Nomurabacteria bacterium]